MIRHWNMMKTKESLVTGISSENTNKVSEVKLSILIYNLILKKMMTHIIFNL